MIKLKNVTKSFKDKKALDNLSLNVNSGEIYGLLGANGAGKSTALNLLLGFLDSDSGSIEISNDKKLVSRDMIGYIPENVNLYPYLNCKKLYECNC
ncbi:MAG: ATP-binding cassette domain-containing protein [Flavobacteriales bacterium]